MSPFLRRVQAAKAAELLAVSAILSVVGCGGGSPPPPPGWVNIYTQPTSQIAPIGSVAIFTVTAYGPYLSYQWIKNGVSIPGATESSYTTPTVSLADSGTQYQVTVTSAPPSESQVSETSNVVTLTAGPRAPAEGDVRYLLWQQAGPRNEDEPRGLGSVGAVNVEITNALGTPVGLGNLVDPPACGAVWGYNFLVVPTSMDGEFTTYYEVQPAQGWQSYLESINSPNVVIFSLDVECQAFAVGWVQVQAGGFDYMLEEVPASEVSATIANYGSESRIVTATTYDTTSNEWALISYGWQGDTTTVYESQAAIVSDFWNEAETLANQGYFISAVGGNDTNGYLMVGMRVQGDTMARAILWGTSSYENSVIPDNAYWTTVMYHGAFMWEQ